jgi:hypothetical protein
MSSLNSGVLVYRSELPPEPPATHRHVRTAGHTADWKVYATPRLGPNPVSLELRRGGDPQRREPGPAAVVGGDRPVPQTPAV